MGVGALHQPSLGSKQRMCVSLTVDEYVGFEFPVQFPQFHKILPQSRHFQGKEMGHAARRSEGLLWVGLGKATTGL